jgi:hypothetical protein
MFVMAVVLYYGVNVGEVYWRYYQFQDDMKQEARFAINIPNDKILVHLRARADTLGLPDDAHDITIRRNTKGISIEAEYYETIEIPMKKRDVLFHPHAEATF